MAYERDTKITRNGTKYKIKGQVTMPSDEFRETFGNKAFDLNGPNVTRIMGKSYKYKPWKDNANSKVNGERINENVVKVLNSANFFGLQPNTPLSHTAIHGFTFNHQEQKGRRSSTLNATVNAWNKVNQLQSNQTGSLFAFDLETFGGTSQDKRWNPAGITEFAMRQHDFATGNTKDTNILFTNKATLDAIEEQLKEYKKHMHDGMSMDELKEKHNDIYVTAMRMSLYDPARGAAFEQVNGVWQATALVDTKEAEAGNVGSVMNAFRNFRKMQLTANETTGLTADVEALIQATNAMNVGMETGNGVVMGHNIVNFDRPILSKYINDLYKQQVEIYRDKSQTDERRQQALNAIQLFHHDKNGYVGFNFDENVVLDTLAGYRAARDELGVEFGSLQLEELTKQYMPDLLNQGVAHLGINDVRNNIAIVLDKLPELNGQSPFEYIMNEAKGGGLSKLNSNRATVQLNNKQLFKATGNMLTPAFGGKGFLNYIQYDSGEIYTSAGYHIKNGKIDFTEYAGNTGFTKGSLYKVAKQERIEIKNLPKEVQEQILNTYPEYNGKYLYHASFVNETTGSVRGHSVNIFTTSQDEMESIIGSNLMHIANQGDDGNYTIVDGKRDEIVTAAYKFSNDRVYSQKKKKSVSDTKLINQYITLDAKRHRNDSVQRAVYNHEKAAMRIQGLLDFDTRARQANLGTKLDAMLADGVSLSEVLVGDGTVNDKKYFNKKEMKKINTLLKSNIGTETKKGGIFLDERTKINVAEEYGTIIGRRDYYDNLLQVTKNRLGVKEITKDNAEQATKFFKELDKNVRMEITGGDVSKAKEAKNVYTNSKAYFKSTYDFVLGDKFKRVVDKAQLIDDIWTTERNDDLVSLNFNDPNVGDRFLTSLYKARMGHKANQKNLSVNEIDANKSQAFYSFIVDLDNNRKKHKHLFKNKDFAAYVDNIMETRELTGQAPDDFDAHVGVMHLLNAAKEAKQKNMNAGVFRKFGDISIFNRSKNMTNALNGFDFSQMEEIGKNVGVVQYYGDKDRQQYVNKLVNIFGISDDVFKTQSASLTEFEKRRAEIIKNDVNEKLGIYFNDMLKAGDEHGIGFAYDEVNRMMVAEYGGRGQALNAMPKFSMDEHGIIHVKSGGVDSGVALRLGIKTVNGEKRTYLTTNFDEDFGKEDFFQKLLRQRKRDTGGVDLTDLNKYLKLHNQKTKEFTGYTGSKNDMSVLNAVFDLSSVSEMYYEMFREGGTLGKLLDDVEFNNPELVKLYKDRKNVEKFKEGNIPPDLFMAGINDFINVAKATLDTTDPRYAEALEMFEQAGMSLKETKLVDGLVQLGSRVVGNYSNYFDNVGRPPMTGAGNIKQLRIEDIKALTKYGVQAGSIVESQETLRGIFRESAGVQMTSDFRARQEYITAPIIQRRLTEKRDDLLKANINNVTIQQMIKKNKDKVYEVYDRMIENMSSGTYEQARIVDGRILNNIIDMPIDTSYVSVNKDIIGAIERGSDQSQFERLLGLVGDIDDDGKGNLTYKRRAGTMVKKGEVIAEYTGYGGIKDAIGSKYDLGVLSYSIRTKEDKELTDAEVSAYINKYTNRFKGLQTRAERVKTLTEIMEENGLKVSYKIENVNQASIYKILDQGTEKGMSVAMNATIGEFNEDVNKYFTTFKTLAGQYGLDESKYDFTGKVVGREKAIQAAHEDLLQAINASGIHKKQKSMTDVIRMIDGQTNRGSKLTLGGLMDLVRDERDVFSEMAFGEFGAFHGVMGIVNDAIPKHENLGLSTTAGFNEAVYKYAKAMSGTATISERTMDRARQQIMDAINDEKNDINFLRTTVRGSTVDSVGKKWTMGPNGTMIIDRNEDESDFIDNERYKKFMRYTNDLITALDANVDEDDKLVHEDVWMYKQNAKGEWILEKQETLVGSFKFRTDEQGRKIVESSVVNAAHSIVNDGETISGVTQEYINAKKAINILKQKETLTDDEKQQLRELRAFTSAQKSSVKFMKLDDQGVAIMKQTRFNDTLAEDLGASVRLTDGREKNFTEEKAKLLSAKTGEFISYNENTKAFEIDSEIKGRGENQVWLKKAEQSIFYNEFHGEELTEDMLKTEEYSKLKDTYDYLKAHGAEKVGVYEATNFYEAKGLVEANRFNAKASRGALSEKDMKILQEDHNFELMNLKDYVHAEGSSSNEVIGSIANKRILLDLGDDFQGKDRYIAIPEGGMDVGDEQALAKWQGKIGHLKKLQGMLDDLEGGGKLPDNFYYQSLSDAEKAEYRQIYKDVPEDLINKRNAILNKMVVARQDIIDAADEFNKKDGAFTRISKIEITEAQERLKILSVTSTSANNAALEALGIKQQLDTDSETFMKTAKIQQADGSYKSLHELTELGVHYDAERVGRDYFKRAGYFDKEMLDQMGFTTEEEMEDYLREHGTMRNVTRYPQIMRGSIYNTRIYLDDSMNGKNGISVMAHSMLKYKGDSDGDSESGFNMTIDGINFAVYERQRELAIDELRKQGNQHTGALFERDVRKQVLSQGVVTEDAFVGFREMSIGMDLAAHVENQKWAQEAAEGILDDMGKNIKVGTVGDLNYQIKDAYSDTFKNTRFEAMHLEPKAGVIKQNISDVQTAITKALEVDPDAFKGDMLQVAQDISSGDKTITDIRGKEKYMVLDQAMAALESGRDSGKIDKDTFAGMQADLIQRVRTQQMFEEEASKSTKSAIGSVNNALNALKTSVKTLMGDENSSIFDLNAASVTQELTYELEQQVISGKKVAFELGDTRLLEIEDILGKAKHGQGGAAKDDLTTWMNTYFDKGTTNRIWDRLRPTIREEINEGNKVENLAKSLMEKNANLSEGDATLQAKNRILAEMMLDASTVVSSDEGGQAMINAIANNNKKGSKWSNADKNQSAVPEGTMGGFAMNFLNDKSVGEIEKAAPQPKVEPEVPEAAGQAVSNAVGNTIASAASSGAFTPGKALGMAAIGLGAGLMIAGYAGGGHSRPTSPVDDVSQREQQPIQDPNFDDGGAPGMQQQGYVINIKADTNKGAKHLKRSLKDLKKISQGGNVNINMNYRTTKGGGYSNNDIENIINNFI